MASTSSPFYSSKTPHHGFMLDQTTTTTNPTKMTKRQEKKAKAKRALWTLFIAVSVPLSLTMTIILLFGSGKRYRSLTKPFWFPPLWFVHLASLGSSFLTGFAAWLFWADGGFHAHPDALPLYIAQISLSIVWDPLVLVIGAASLGLVFCLVHFGTLFACYRSFRRVNPFAKDLMKPCLAWVAYLTLVNYKLIYFEFF
ncbi:translocator protein homolog [Morus notabilis]|uniref:translocator protein homolog n=1 Tax=Morus notabilis TaxID=981085 RepID=UPI000CED4379|nr:translocator protein homolog [Morus notabilis]